MDANGLRFWMLSEERHWHISGAVPGLEPDLEYDRRCYRLRLASRRPAAAQPPLRDDAESIARSQLEQVPHTRDRYNGRAFWNGDDRTIRATSVLPSSVPLIALPVGERPTDLAMGYDGVLYAALDSGAVLLRDLRDRWSPVRLMTDDFIPWRLAAAPHGGVWLLDRIRRQVARLEGLPRPAQGFVATDPDQFCRCGDLEGPQLTVLTSATLPAGEEPVAIACSPTGVLALLTWVEASAQLRCLNSLGEWTEAIGLNLARYPYSLAWVDEVRVALLLPELTTEAPVYEVARLDPASEATPDLAFRLSDRLVSLRQQQDAVSPTGEVYPLRDYDSGSFLSGESLPPHYLSQTRLTDRATGVTTATVDMAPLHPLSLRTFAEVGEALGGFPTGDEWLPIDSGNAQTLWHRLYFEAVIPPHCGIQLFLAASDRPDITTIEQWYEHRAGERFAPGDGTVPRAAWLQMPSEIPFHPGLLNGSTHPHQSGLFTVLIQRNNRAVRSLRGRYLWVRVRLLGDGNTTPELAVVRAYGDRFSYVNQYLPELYREDAFGPDADAIAPSTAADFLERFLSNVEGFLTPLEDRIAQSYLLTDPRTAPDNALDWLGRWIGVSLDPVYPPERRRALLQHTPELYRQRGTLSGLKFALEVATGGISGGEIVVLEDFRLRRTFATLLGVDLADEDDPLLGGLTVSGNSYVGDTLILGDESRREFLAVFRADGPESALLHRHLPKAEVLRSSVKEKAADEKAIADFFDALAHRVTILVHQAVEPQQLGLIRRIVELETPAHIASRVVTARYPFIVSIAALVGVDTYLAPPPTLKPVRVNRSQIGVNDVIHRSASLDPRLEAGRISSDELRSPAARLAAPTEVQQGTSFTLDASASRAPQGGAIERYIWRLTDNPS